MIPLQFKITFAVFAATLLACLVLVGTLFSWGNVVVSSSDNLENSITKTTAALNAGFALHPEMSTLNELFTVEPIPDPLGLYGSLLPVDDAGRINAAGGFQLSRDSDAGRLPWGCVPSTLHYVAEANQFWGSTFRSCQQPAVALGIVSSRTSPARTWVLLMWAAPYGNLSNATPSDALPPTLLVEALVLLVVTTLVTFRVTERIGRAASDAVRVSDRMAEGDLAARMKPAGDDEFGVIAQSFNKVADRLTAAVAASERSAAQQARFVSDTAHELRTPTSALLASAVALEDPATRDEAATRVVPQLRRLSALTENLLELSRLDAGRAPVRAEDLDLTDLAAEAVADAPGASLGGVPLGVRTDPVLVRSILGNLLDNAARYGRPPVEVRVFAHAGRAVVTVADAGDGVPEDLRDFVFDRFVRGDAARHGSGSGLGLAIAREHARLLRGDLTLDADGRTFRLSLPL